MKLIELYQKYINLDYKKRILIFIVIALILRLLFAHEIDMELDTYYYACLTQDIKTSITTGKIFTYPVNHAHYRGIEYRPPLYSLLAAFICIFIGNVEISLIAVSMVAGCILIIPVFLMARRLWGDPAGDLASLVLVFSPHLILYSIMGRTESLYVLLFTMGVYFAILAFEQGRINDFILSGVFWGLAYQTRFEALAGAFATASLFFFRVVDKRTKENRKESLKKAGAFILALFILILPYSVIIYKTSGELGLTSPSKKMLDMEESLWITTAKPGGYTSFNYYYGAPGEYDYKKLKTLIKKSPDQLLAENAGVIIPAIIREIPLNLKMILVNFNILILLFLLIPFIVKWKLRDPRIAILWLYFLAAIPIILLSYWSTDPRYYSFFIPLIAINAGGILKILLEGNKLNLVENEKLNFIFSWILIPAALLLSWYFYLDNPMIPGWLEFNPRILTIALHKSLVILVFLFAGTGILAIAMTILWKRVFPSLVIPVMGLGILILLAGFLEAKITHPVKAGAFFTQNFYGPVRSVLLWLLTAGLIYEGILFIKRKYKNPLQYQKSLVILSLVFLFLVNMQNIIFVNKELNVFRYENYHPKAVAELKNRNIKPASVMCPHPRDAFALDAKWVKIPPKVSFNEFREAFDTGKPQSVIIDSQPMTGISFRPAYPIFLIMKERGKLSEVRYYEKNNNHLKENKIRVWVYSSTENGEQKAEKESTTETLRTQRKEKGTEDGKQGSCHCQQSEAVSSRKTNVSLRAQRSNLILPSQFPLSISHPVAACDIPFAIALPIITSETKNRKKVSFSRNIASRPGTAHIPVGRRSLEQKPDSNNYLINPGSKGPLPLAKKTLPKPHPWSKFHNDLRNTGRSPFEGPGMGAAIAWKFKTGHEIFSSPVISKKGHIIFGCDDSNIYALDSKGNLVWKYKGDYYMSASPALSPDRTVYIGSDDQNLYSLSPKGKLNWRFKTKYYISSGAVVTAEGNIITCGEDSFVYCLDKKGGLIWKYKTGGEIIGTPAISGKTLYVTCQDGNLYFISMEGNLLRKFKAGGELVSSPAVANDGTIYFGSGNHHLYAVSGKGKSKWKYKTGGPVLSSPAIAPDGTILFGSNDGCLYALSPGGKLLWKFETGFSVESSPAVDALGRVYFGSHDRHIYGLSPDGKLLWKVKTEGAVYSSPAIGSDGTIYAGSMDKYLYAIKRKKNTSPK